jgi:hypothetical protein
MTLQPYAVITGNTITSIEFHDPSTYAGGLLLLAGINPMPWERWTTPDNGTTWVAPPLPVDVQNQQALNQKAQTALSHNATFLGIASPTSAQAITQVQALTRQTNALIRLVLGLLDSTSGT